MSASHRFGPSKAILAHDRGTAPFPLSKKGVARRNLVCDIWLTGGNTNGAEKEPQDWGALVADRRKELISFKHCLFLRHVWHVSEVVANIFTQRYFLTFHISFLRFYSLKEQPPVILSHFLTGVISVGWTGTEEWGVIEVPFATIPFPSMHGLSPTSSGNDLHLMRLGHEKPCWRIRGAQPSLARSKIDQRGGASF